MADPTTPQDKSLVELEAENCLLRLTLDMLVERRNQALERKQLERENENLRACILNEIGLRLEESR